MECSERPVWNEYTREELCRLTINTPDVEAGKKVSANWDKIAKPLDGMGKFEVLTSKIGAIMHTDKIDISKKAVIIMCADNGIVEEGVSQSTQEITISVVRSMAKKQSSVCKMAQVINADTIPVDIGINSSEKIDGVLDRKISCGTKNFSREPAMTEKEAINAIANGIDMVYYCIQRGYKIIATGEMGIGNTTTSSAVCAALLKCDADRVTGRGAGLSDEALLNKREVIAAAIEKYDLHNADALTVLKTVGGLDIAGLAGVCIGGALFNVPIVLDGVISMAAALVAEEMFPGTGEYLIPSHKGKEPAVNMLMNELNVTPVIDADLALGEGTGAVMMLSLLDMALSIYNTGASFSELKIEQYERIK